MATNSDIYKTANEYIQRYGENAAILAAMQSDEHLAKGDLDGHQIWILILKAVDELQSEGMPDGVRIN